MGTRVLAPAFLFTGLFGNVLDDRSFKPEICHACVAEESCEASVLDELGHSHVPGMSLLRAWTTSRYTPAQSSCTSLRRTEQCQSSLPCGGNGRKGVVVLGERNALVQGEHQNNMLVDVNHQSLPLYELEC